MPKKQENGLYRAKVRIGVTPDGKEIVKYASAASESRTEGGTLDPEARGIQRKMHQTIKRVTDDFQGRWHFNTCIAAIMEFVNTLYGAEDKIANGIVPAWVVGEVERTVALLLAPFAPYISHELWEMMGEKGSVFRTPWPKYDPKLAKEEELEIPVQVNGKLRSKVVVAFDAGEEQVWEAVFADEKVKAASHGKTILKKIYVPGKLVNLVLR
jgi:leucyl-tRNA synthetase